MFRTAGSGRKAAPPSFYSDDAPNPLAFFHLPSTIAALRVGRAGERRKALAELGTLARVLEDLAAAEIVTACRGFDPRTARAAVESATLFMKLATALELGLGLAEQPGTARRAVTA